MDDKNIEMIKNAIDDLRKMSDTIQGFTTEFRKKYYKINTKQLPSDDRVEEFFSLLKQIGPEFFFLRYNIKQLTSEIKYIFKARYGNRGTINSEENDKS